MVGSHRWKRLRALAVFLAVLQPASAVVGRGYDATSIVEQIFEAADTDSNGELTEAEYTDAGLERFGVTFEQCDADGDGVTTLAEYLALYLRHHPPSDDGAI